MIPRALRLQNFGSFGKRQTFEFPRAPGLYFMQGRNEAEPRLTGNATGKTTLWKALCWLFYGKTPDGLKAGDVCNWGADKGVEVSLEFSEDGDGLPEFVTRTWGPISWRHRDLFGKDADLTKAAENPVLDALGLGFDPFLRAVLFAQGEDAFLDMKKDRQAELFSAVMDLDGWVQRADRASDAAKAQDAKSRGLEKDLAGAAGRLDALLRVDLAGDADKWEADCRKRLAALAQDHDDLVKRRKALRGALDEAVGREDAARAGVAAAQPDEALEAEFEAAGTEVRRIEDEMTKLAVRTDALAEHMAELNKGDRADCPVCKRPFDTKHWQQEVERAKRAAESVAAMAGQLARKLEPARNRHKVLDGKLDEVARRRQQARAALDDAARATSRARSDLALADKQLDGLEDAYDRAEKEVNPFAGAIERAKREADDLRHRERELRRSLDDSNWLWSIKSNWVRWFKEIRLREIAAALSELEVEVNSCVTELGLVDWELEFRVDRETKGGGVQRGFSTFVRAPASGDRAVPWEAWSGGEKQRLRLAADMGLGNLIRARTGCDFPLEVWDEPTNGLSPEGKADLFAALAGRARREGRVIFLTDHQAHAFGGFAGTCTVVKTPSGSRVRASWAGGV